MLHAVMAWLVAIPFFIFIASLGAGGYLGGWYAGLAGTPVWVTNAPALPNDVAYAVVRNNALGALTALILGLIGSVLGGWLASGQPMHFWSTSPTTTTTTTHADGRVIVAH
jgi:hypothetical protein